MRKQRKKDILLVMGLVGGVSLLGYAWIRHNQSSNPPPPTTSCNDGDVQNIIYCSDGVTPQTYQICIGGTWSSAVGECPVQLPPPSNSVCPEGTTFNTPICQCCPPIGEGNCVQPITEVNCIPLPI